MQNNNDNTPIKEEDDDNKNSTLPTTGSARRYFVVSSILIVAASALAILALVSAGETAQVFAIRPPGPCPNCVTEIHGNGTGTITIPESAEIGPAPCDECEAEIFFDATVFEETGGGVLGKLTIKYIDQEGVEHTIDGTIDKAKTTEKSFNVKGDLIGPPQCALCEEVRFTLTGKVGAGESVMTFEAGDNADDIVGQFVGEVTISSTSTA